MELRYKSSGGCPVGKPNMGAIEKFFTNNTFIVGLAMIPVGVLFAFFGFYIIDVILFITALCSISIGVSYMGLSITQSMYGDVDSQPDWLLWTVLGAGLIAGLIVACFISTCRKIGILILAGSGGVVAGIVVCHAFAISNTIPFWAITAVCTVLSCILIGFLEKILIIIITSSFGSYLFVRGISMFAGGFPNEITVAELFKEGTMPWTQYKMFWPYVGAIIGCFILAGIVQLKVTGIWKQRKSSESENNSGAQL